MSGGIGLPMPNYDARALLEEFLELDGRANMRMPGAVDFRAKVEAFLARHQQLPVEDMEPEEWDPQP